MKNTFCILSFQLFKTKIYSVYINIRNQINITRFYNFINIVNQESPVKTLTVHAAT